MSSDNPDPPIYVEQQYDGDTPPSVAIVKAIACIEDVDPVESPSELGITLYDHIDPTALDQLITKNTGNGDVSVGLTVRNEYQYEVRIYDSGWIVIERGL